jgi:hypothetical protein
MVSASILEIVPVVLKITPQVKGTKYQFTGFDILPLQFPNSEYEKRNGMKFMAHDMTKSFPPQHHGTCSMT